jgi:hypothetical protein
VYFEGVKSDENSSKLQSFSLFPLEKQVQAINEQPPFFGLVIALLMSNFSFQLELELQVQTAEVMKSLMKKERNQQVMCEAGLPHELLSHCEVSLYNEAHPLHPPLQYVFERLAAQSLTPKDLM